jgi:hypothetical protein
MSFAARPSVGQFKGCDIILAFQFSPYVVAYNWSNGFGNRYPDPVTLPFSTTRTVEFHPNGEYLVVGGDYSVAVSYTWAADTGFGIRQQTTYTVPNQNRLRFSSSGKYLGAATLSGQLMGYLILWTNEGSGFGQRFISRTNNPDEDQAGLVVTGHGVDISPDERHLVFVTRFNDVYSPHAYPISESGFGTRLSSPSPKFASDYVLFSPKGDVVYFASPTSPTIRAYAFNDGFGTKFSDPVGVAEATNAYRISIAPDGKTVAVISLTAEPSPSSRAFIYEWNNGFGARYSNPVTLPAPSAVRFSPSGSEIAFGLFSEPYVHVYQWSNNTGFGTKFADPAVLPTATVQDIAWKAP